MMAMMKWRPSVRTRHLLVVISLLLAVAFALTIFSIAHLTRAEVAARRESEKIISHYILVLTQQALLAGTGEEPFKAIGNNESLREVMKTTTGQGGEFAWVAIVSMTGEIIAISDPDNLSRHAGRIRPFENLENSNWMSIWRATRQTGVYYELSSPPGNLRGKPFARVRLGASAQAILGNLGIRRQQLLLLALVLLGLGLLAATMTATLVLRPLRDLMASIEQLEAVSSADVARAMQGIAPEPEPAPALAGEDPNSVTQRLRALGKRFAGNRLELETMRDQLQKVVSNLSERVVLLDRERRVLMASPEAERLLCGGHFPLRGKPIHDSLGARHPLSLLTERAFFSRQSLRETALISANGDEPQKMLTSVQIFEDHGAPAGALVTMRDFESLQQLESQLDYATKLAALNRITSGVAHEVKNPLHAMVLHLELLNAKLDAGVDPKTHVQVLTSEVNRLNRVVQTFLDFTRPVALNLIAVDATRLTREVMLLAADARAENVQVIERYADDALPVKADVDLLKQAILNIVINGFQAMAEGGQLRVTTGHDASGNVLISVSDQGPGIPDSVRDKIFNLYYTTKPNGSGIGLAQAFRAVQLHNGRIEVDSHPGAGARFRITLPPA
ncbi:MAG: ATP-binding protein [Blastocatellia bacterium]